MKKYLLAAGLAVTLAAPVCRAEQPMNILMIALDDLNDWVGFMDGHPQTLTPNMDRLAAQSMVFENAQCAAPSCNPSRGALMSGIAPHVSGLHSNNQEMRAVPGLKNVVMFPRYLSDHGYTSMVRGKIFHHADMDPQTWDIMSNQKKDRFKIPPAQLTDMSPYKHIHEKGALFEDVVKTDKKGKRKRAGNLFWASTMEPKEMTTDYQNAMWAADWLLDEAEQKTPKPFFLACGIFRPHLPWVVPAEYYAKFDLATIQLPPIKGDDLADTGVSNPSKEYDFAVKHGLRKEAARAYLASINYADECVGVILDALEKSPYKDNTIVVLWGDHGWHLGEKQRYKKFTLWEEAAHMPFIIKVPGLPVGRSKRPVNLLDLYPTLVELAGAPAKEGLSGRSIVPLLKNPDIEWDFPSLTSKGAGNFSLRNERWRYIQRADGFEELYDHETDPQEWTNLADNPEYESVKAAMRAHLPKADEGSVLK